MRGLDRIYPVRNPIVKWFRNPAGNITLVYNKQFSRFERWLYKHFGGCEYIRRPLDKYGSLIWKLCDGNHTIADICIILEREFQEELEPVAPRVQKFLEILLRLNLIKLTTKKKQESSWKNVVP